jgi:hypothetical protein
VQSCGEIRMLGVESARKESDERDAAEDSWIHETAEGWIHSPTSRR